jgi:outer membrane protein assembly factor BamE
MRIKIILLSLLLLSPVLSSCAIYKMDIRQGNFVTQDMREKLKLGMTKPQVRYVLGTPMINDAFHGNRWDYAYRLEHGGKMVEKQNLTLYFEADILARIDDGNQAVETAPAKVEVPVNGQ